MPASRQGAASDHYLRGSLGPSPLAGFKGTTSQHDQFHMYRSTTEARGFIDMLCERKRSAFLHRRPMLFSGQNDPQKGLFPFIVINTGACAEV